VLQRSFDLNESKRLIADEGVTQLYGVPMMFQLLLDSCQAPDLAEVNYCFSAAATLPVQVGQRWQEKFGLPIHEGYGLTETSPFASYNHRNLFVCGSIGTPIDNVEMKVVDTETGRECAPEEPGEIIIRGPNVMLGYWNREEDTREVLRDGWFWSGDIGRKDKDGYFYIVDRVKDMIAVGGLKVFPAEVERVLLDHSSIAQVAVVGVADDVAGELVVAFVVLAEHADEHSVESIAKHGKTQLANYKVPRVIIPIEALPRNPSGKILKRELREYDVQSIRLRLSGEHKSADDSNIQSSRFRHKPTLRRLLTETHASAQQGVADEFVQQLVKTVSGLDELPDAETRFRDAGLDSLMIVEISNQLQAEFGPGYEIPATLVFDHPRICDLAEFLVQTLLPVSNAENGDVLLSEKDSPEERTTEPKGMRSEIESMSEEDALRELMRELA
jgi:long-chain acyl-CoA synthetase